MKLVKSNIIDNHRMTALRNCITVAIERFQEHVDEMKPAAEQYEAADDAGKKALEAATPMVHPRVYRQLSDQFEGQIEEARKLLDWLDGDAYQDASGEFPEGTDFVVVAGLVRDY
ncbi:hypothetical protein CcrC1_gp533 [Caulobacter phage C1]|nr:hypothetical protein CcrC1_gp040 [Caulobacter phage C1]UTU08267.1 hypothetical protein CcrC2_gp039 [Caulobacter phage C2]UTU08790.1 hypothetical protein CcrJ4_gp039 [Caulobacter phage J4]UTU09328.1 hypothetical protein CcrBL47_gp042 [Caulobacter phage BL47]UTU09902.1 hypothetical protein CcrRB23_gp040 [Caulobacter phage RB23]WGN96927.1 hypothetical protein [Bertelyvirus sp.]